MVLHIVVGILIVSLIISFFIYKCVTQRRFKQCILDFIRFQLFNVLLAIICIDVIYILMHDVKSLFDFSLLTAFIASSLIGVLCSVIARFFRNQLEDSTKLTRDYKALVKKYDVEKNHLFDTKIYTRENEDDTCFIPVIVDHTWDKFNDIEIGNDKINVDDCYKIPDEIEEYKDDLFLAHKSSNVYNQLNIRVDSWEISEKDNNLIINTSRTTYYASLMTNRAMDYSIHNGFSVRELLQPGPFVPDLEDSRLSNHLGFNGFIVTNDAEEYIPFIKRNKIVSIGKNTYGTSVSASLKTKYVLDSFKGKVTKEGIMAGIRGEVTDELKIKKGAIEDIKIIAAYRDLVEGNKPQLLVIVRVNKSKEEIISDFEEAIKEKKSKKRKLSKEEKEQEDGNLLIWVKKEDFINELKVSGNCFKCDKSVIVTQKGENNKESFSIVPSVAASIVLAQGYLKKK